jgi:uncharacterized protein YqjF (DUF2071 family)
MRVSNPLTSSARQAAVLREISGRPWALPQGRWLFAQTWEDVLFCHWRVPLSALGALVPRPLEIDTFEGSAWVGIIPFRLTGFRVRGLPAAPRLSSFPELNVRTYVTDGKRPGIFFISLDAARDWAVWGARRVYKLPYYRARMSMTKPDWIEFSSERVGAGPHPRKFSARYRPAGAPQELGPGTLEHFLTERYCLYTTDGVRVLRGDAHHVPWSIQPAEAEIGQNSMAPAPIELEGEPLLHYSSRQDALIWPLRAVG